MTETVSHDKSVWLKKKLSCFMGQEAKRKGKRMRVSEAVLRACLGDLRSPLLKIPPPPNDIPLGTTCLIHGHLGCRLKSQQRCEVPALTEDLKTASRPSLLTPSQWWFKYTFVGRGNFRMTADTCSSIHSFPQICTNRKWKRQTDGQISVSTFRKIGRKWLQAAFPCCCWIRSEPCVSRRSTWASKGHSMEVFTLCLGLGFPERPLIIEFIRKLWIKKTF